MAAIIAMIIAVLAYGFFPFFVSLLKGAGVKDIEYLVLLQMTSFLLVLISLVVVVNIANFRLQVLTQTLRGSWRTALIAMLFNTASNLFLFKGMTEQELLKSAIVYESWPILFMILTYFKSGLGKFRTNYDLLTTTVLLAIGAYGMFQVTANQRVLSDILEFTQVGFNFGLLAAFAMAMSQFFGTGTVRNAALSLGEQKDQSRIFVNIVAALVIGAFFRLISLIYALLLFVFYDGDFSSLALSVPILLGNGAFLYCACVVGLGGVVYHFANVTSAYSNINLLYCFTPVVAVAAFVFILGVTEFNSQVLVGIMLILTTTFALGMNVGNAVTFKVTFVGFIFLTILSLQTDIGGSFDHYWEALGLIAAFFTIISAFSIDRLVQRHQLTNTYLLDFFQSLPSSILAEKRTYRLLQKLENQGLTLSYLYALQSKKLDINQFKKLNRVLVRSNSDILFKEVFSIVLVGMSLLVFMFLGRDPTTYFGRSLPIVLGTATVYTLSLAFEGRPKMDLNGTQAFGVARDWRSLRQQKAKAEIQHLINGGLLLIIITLYFVLIHFAVQTSV